LDRRPETRYHEPVDDKKPGGNTAIMGENIRLTAADGFELGAYRARPDGAVKGGVVVVQEIFGVNVHIRSVCDRYAAAATSPTTSRAAATSAPRPTWRT
jgi:hypothetical protein